MFGMDAHANSPVLPRLLEPDHREFPSAFFDLPVPPDRLWVRGTVPADGVRTVAMVGSRATSRRGATAIAALSADLAAQGWVVVSGGALGIDAAAHAGALEARGLTFAVLGCGIDVLYPDRHGPLFARILQGGGGLLSEYGPGTPPRRGQFPRRNRLVAALAQVVVVGESRPGSGALITARQAQALGRPLLAIPGSAGTDGLLALGAALPVQSAGDLELALAPGARVATGAAVLRPLFQRVLEILGQDALGAEVLAQRLGLPLAEALGALCEAELAGLVSRAPGARFEARFKGRVEASRGH